MLGVTSKQCTWVAACVRYVMDQIFCLAIVEASRPAAVCEGPCPGPVSPPCTPAAVQAAR